MMSLFRGWMLGSKTPKQTARCFNIGQCPSPFLVRASRMHEWNCSGSASIQSRSKKSVYRCTTVRPRCALFAGKGGFAASEEIGE